MTLCPAGVDHGQVGEPASGDPVGPGEGLVVDQLEEGQDFGVGDDGPVVVGQGPGPNPVEHVGGDGGVVDVAGRPAAPEHFEEGQGEGVTHRVDVNVGAELVQRLVT